MSTELGFSPAHPSREEVEYFVQKARRARAEAVAELFGFGFATVKKALVATTKTRRRRDSLDVPRGTPA